MKISLAEWVERERLRKRRAAASRIRLHDRGLRPCLGCQRYSCVCSAPPGGLGA